MDTFLRYSYIKTCGLNFTIRLKLLRLRSRLPDGSIVNKHFCGTAIPMLPGFLIAHVYAKNSHYKADGYTKPYSLSVSISAILFMFFTLLVFAKILLMLGIKHVWVSVLLPIMVFGTNWYYYVVCEPSVSHVYSVFFITYFAYLGLKWGLTDRLNFVLMAAVLGLIVLIRPVNGIAISLVPFFFSSLQHFKKQVASVFKSPLKLLLATLVFFLIISLQFILYKIQTGNFIVLSYKNESFDFTNPQFWNILFSYKKGLFLYTPIYLVSLAGVIAYFKRDSWRASVLMFVFILFTYVASSWWNWYYGGSFSSRVYIDYLLIFTIPMAFMLQRAKRRVRKYMLLPSIILLTVFCQFQTFQFRKMVIHWDSMTKDKYWGVFMDFDVFK